MSLGERSGDPLMVFTGHEALFGVHLLCGDAAGADRALAECVRLADALRYRFVLFQARFFEGARAACSGDLDAAERIFAEALERGRGRVPLRRRSSTTRTRSGCASSAAIAPRLGASAALLEGISRYWKGGETVARAALALIARIEGRDDDARRILEEISERGLASLERDEHFLLTAAILSDVILELDDRERAAELYDVLLPYAPPARLPRPAAHLRGQRVGRARRARPGARPLRRRRRALRGGARARARASARAPRRSRARWASRASCARARRRGDARRADALLARGGEPTPAALGIRWRERFRFDPRSLASGTLATSQPASAPAKHQEPIRKPSGLAAPAETMLGAIGGHSHGSSRPTSRPRPRPHRPASRRAAPSACCAR